MDVKNAARQFVRDPAGFVANPNATTVSHLLFSIKPQGRDGAGRQVPIAEMATDRIKSIISYAAADADAEDGIKFYHTISKHPDFRISAGQMFEKFVLCW